MDKEQEFGQLIGTVAGLTSAFENMQRAQENNRREFMDIFKEIRDTTKEVATGFTQHVKEDSVFYGNVASLEDWRGDGDGAENKINIMWDERNKTTGIMSVSRLAGGLLWGIIVLIVGYFAPHKL